MNNSRIRRILLAVTAAAFLSAPALAETVRGNGVMKTETRAVSGFTAVGLGIAAKVEVRVGATEGIAIEADENLLPLIETSVKRGELEIKAVRYNLNLDSRQIRIVVNAKQIDQLDIGGSGSITADVVKGKKLSLDIGGSGSIDVKKADVEKVSVNIGGSGDVKVGGGSAKRLNISIAGSGDTDTRGLLSDEVDINIAGAGDAVVAARNSIAVLVAGSGSVQYFGDPSIKQTVLGSGRIKRLGAMPQ
jgi:hypothetical protein